MDPNIILNIKNVFAIRYFAVLQIDRQLLIHITNSNTWLAVNCFRDIVLILRNLRQFYYFIYRWILFFVMCRMLVSFYNQSCCVYLIEVFWVICQIYLFYIYKFIVLYFNMHFLFFHFFRFLYSELLIDLFGFAVSFMQSMKRVPLNRLNIQLQKFFFLN